MIRHDFFLRGRARAFYLAPLYFLNKSIFSSKGDSGTGLGLFISNRILSQHGGGITLDSTPDIGTRFFIKIPKKASLTNPLRENDR